MYNFLKDNKNSPTIDSSNNTIRHNITSLGLDCLEDAVKTEIHRRDTCFKFSPALFNEKKLPTGIHKLSDLDEKVHSDIKSYKHLAVIGKYVIDCNTCTVEGATIARSIFPTPYEY